MKKNKILALALTGVLGVSSIIAPSVAVEASPSSVSEADSLISNLNDKENKAISRLKEIEKEIKNNEEKADELLAEMKETETTLDELRTEIEDLKVVIEKREVHLAEQARALQVVGESGNVVKFVLNAESLNEIVSRMDVVSTLLSSNEQTIVEQNKDKEAVEVKETETVKKQEDQAKLAGELETNKATLEEKQNEQEKVIAEISADKSLAKSEREQLVAQARRAVDLTRSSNSGLSGSVTTASSSASGNSNTSSSSNSSKNDQKPTTTPPKATNGSVVGIAQGLTGIPYHYGGGTTSGFDCSGFTTYVFNQAGKSLPRTASGQYAGTTRISRSQAQPGDLVFFRQGGGVDHVGIYLGGGKFIGSQTSTGVAVSTIDSGYWANYFVGFGR